MPELGAQPDRSPAARLLTPRSVLVAGVSQRPDTLGQRVLGNLVASGYSGDIHVLGRTPATLFGLECATSFDELPRGIDLVLLTAPAAGTIDLVRGCVSHGVGAAVCYASGFAEQGEEGRRQEAELGRIAGEGGMGLVGPNCFGFLNTVDDLPTLLTSISAVPVPDADLGRGVAVIAQSGSIGAYVASSLGSRGVPISYLVTTGNEIGLGTPELIEFFSDSEHTGAIAVYAEQVRDPERFTAAVRKAYERGKPIVFMHPGRGERGRAAVASHTGALTGDHAVMTTMVRRAGVAVVDTLEELIDLSQLLLRYPRPPSKGASVITVSGALCAIATDTAEAFGLDLPSPTVTDNELAKALPFTEVRNPIDLSTQTLTQPALLRMAAQQMAEDPNIGSVLVSLPPVGELLDSAWLDQVLAGMGPSGKPLVYVVQNEEEPPPAFLQKVLERRIVFHRSPERAMRVLARVTGYGRARAVGRGTVLHESVSGLPLLTGGVQPEWRGKQVLSALGIPVPDGELAHSTDEALAIAMRVGYPVVAKAQAGRLAHKSDVGAVLLGIED
jgi:acyl-CoA synthetase (NDP forming)